MRITSGISRRHFLKLSASSLALGAAVLTVPAQARPILEQPVRKLFFHNTHTDEVVHTTYWRKGHYDSHALMQFNFIMRDHRSGDVKKIDPQLFDLLHKLQASMRNFSPIEIISGYRSPATNAWLALFTDGVAKKSFHIQGKAIDIRMKDVPSSHIHNAALSLQGGGVGYYPYSDFVHIDTGPVRTWWQQD